MTKPPSRKPDDSDGNPEDKNTQILNVNELHHHPSELKELRKLAEVDPALAYRVLDAEEEKDRRFNTSYRFGLVSTAVLLLVTVCAMLFAIVHEGLFSTFLLIGLILSLALLIRVILTGRWSETTWFGKIVSSITKALGSEEPNVDE